MGKRGPRKAQTRSQIQEILIYEHQFLKRGLALACIDEAGRGALAGPLVVGALFVDDISVFYEPECSFIKGDSKKLREEDRFLAFDTIKKYFRYSIGIATHEEIDDVGIIKATKLAMRRALEKLKGFDIVLSDFINLEDYDCIPIVKGDEKSFSIRLASLVAKATRDTMMKEYSLIYKPFSFDKHKGYGTKEHIQEIKAFGLSDIHRRSFCYNI
ncbi:MAG: ribonuclease HII [Hydrogenobaculum sp.]|nr:MAG: ribonuclease HII [Hydrogenobaculum sp.]